MVIAKEIMHRGTPVLSFETKVPEAIEYFRKHPTSFVAISADIDRYHGVLTEAGLMRIYLRYKSNPAKDSLILYRDLLEPTQLIHENETFPDIVKKLVTAVGNRIFVINDKGAVIGYITAKDILPFFTEGQSEKQFIETTRSLQSDLYLFESFFTKSPFMMHSVNHHGVIQMANEMLHAVLGYEYGELIGKTIFDIYPEENHKKAEAGIKQIFDKGYHKVIQAQMIDKKGKRIDVELVSRALTDQDDKPIGTITVSRPLDMNYLLGCLPHS